MNECLYPYSRQVGSQSEAPEIHITSKGTTEISGYQYYSFAKGRLISAKPVHQIKYGLIRSYLLAAYKEKAIIDIGCSAGVIGVQAILDGCENVNFVDHDKDYIDVVRQVLGQLRKSDSDVYVSAVGEFADQFQVGIALALIHWIYSYSELSGSLRRAVGLLHRIAPEALFIEWVAPADPAIEFAGHIAKNQQAIQEPYDFEHFMDALQAHYAETIFVGRIDNTREIWLATNKKISVPEKEIRKALKKVERLKKKSPDGLSGVLTVIKRPLRPFVKALRSFWRGVGG
jgi:hypothetical protein